MIVQLTFPLPPTLNEQINLARSHWSQSAKAKKVWTNKLAAMCYGSPTFSGQVWVQFEWQLKSFSRDSDNVSASAKYIFDSLVDSGVICKDNLTIVQSPVVHWYKRGSVEQVVVSISDSPEFLVQSLLSECKQELSKTRLG